MSKQRTSFTKEFKDEAVDMILVQGHIAKQVATNLGINYKMLCGWKAKRVQSGGYAFPGKGRKTDAQAELATLKADNKRLRMERDILKKAAAFFAKEMK